MTSPKSKNPTTLASEITHKAYLLQLVCTDNRQLEYEIACMIRDTMDEMMKHERADWNERIKGLENALGMRKVTDAETLAKLFYYTTQRHLGIDDPEDWDPEKGSVTIAVLDELMRAGFIST